MSGEMYDRIPLILTFIMFLMAVFMILFPKQHTKKAQREDPEAIKKTKKNGYIGLFATLILILLELVELNMGI